MDSAALASLAAAPPRIARPVWKRLTCARELGLVAAVGVVAIAIRLPSFQFIPAFTDETEDILRGWLITQGRLFPLTDSSSYIGSLWNWLVAAAFWISGDNLYAPRALILAIGVLTVVATYPLGRAWGGRVGGLLAASLLTTSAEHIAVNSHVAWSNCVTPLFTALGTWMLWEAVGRPRYLLLAGLLWGLALQTHPSVVALLPGAVGFLLWRGRSLLASRWLPLAAVLFLLVNLNLLVYNLGHGFDSISYGAEIAASYGPTPHEQLTPVVYAGRFGLLALGLLQDVGGAIEARENDVEPLRDPVPYLLDPGLWPLSLLAAAGLVWQWRRGNPLPALLVASAALILPLFNGKYEPILNGRYLAPLLPVLYAGVGALLAAFFGWLAERFADWPTRRTRLVGAALGLGLLCLILHPLLYLKTYYEQAPRMGRTNGRFFRTIEQIKSSRPGGEIVLLDQPLRDMVFGPGAGRIFSAFRLALEVNRVPYQLVDLGSPELLDPRNRCRDQLAVLASRKPEVNDAIFARLDLHAIGPSPARVQQQSFLYYLYRLDRLPDAPAC